jgi:prepilin-type processing-associated H-X9-DG protein
MYEILPYLDQGALYKQGQSRDFTIQENAWATIVPAFLCPADPRENAGGTKAGPPDTPYPFGPTSYLGVLGQRGIVYDWGSQANWDGVFRADKGVKLSEITDGHSNTLMVGERPPPSYKLWGAWMGDVGDNLLWAIVEGSFDIGGQPCPEPFYFSPGDLANDCHVNHFWSFHTGGGNWLLCDGSVHFIPYTAGIDINPRDGLDRRRRDDSAVGLICTNRARRLGCMTCHPRVEILFNVSRQS